MKVNGAPRTKSPYKDALRSSAGVGDTPKSKKRQKVVHSEWRGWSYVIEDDDDEEEEEEEEEMEPKIPQEEEDANEQLGARRSTRNSSGKPPKAEGAAKGKKVSWGSPAAATDVHSGKVRDDGGGGGAGASLIDKPWRKPPKGNVREGGENFSLENDQGAAQSSSDVSASSSVTQDATVGSQIVVTDEVGLSRTVLTEEGGGGCAVLTDAGALGAIIKKERGGASDGRKGNAVKALVSEGNILRQVEASVGVLGNIATGKVVDEPFVAAAAEPKVPAGREKIVIMKKASKGERNVDAALMNAGRNTEKCMFAEGKVVEGAAPQKVEDDAESKIHDSNVMISITSCNNEGDDLL